jgi:pimeloyl-ACP methyl ester carboxylesterase
LPPVDIPQHLERITQARAALVAAGLERRELDGTVYFVVVPKKPRATYVLVHGVNDQAGTWAAVAAKLAEHNRVVIPDLPGHGESGPKEGSISMPLMLERLHAVIEKEAPGKVVLVGSSMGAWVDVLYTLAHADRVERLVLESGGGLGRPPGVPLVASNREEAIKILHAVHGPKAPTPDWAIDTLLEMKDGMPMQRVLASGLLPYFTDARLKDVKVPTKIIWGADDGVVPRSYVDDVQKGIEGSTLCVIEGAAHIPHAQQPERFLACLTSTS